MINFWFSIELAFSLFATESRIYPTATGKGDFSSSLYLCFLLFLAMKILLSIEKATVETVATGNIVLYLIFRFHEEMFICRFHELSHPYVKHTTKKYNSEKQKTQATKMDLIAWGFCFCIVSYSKRSWTL